MTNATGSDSTRGRATASSPSVDRITSAALRLFADGGYNSTIAEIADAAGVSRALLFHHFGSKEGILQAVVEQVRAEAEKVFSRADGLTGLAALRAYLETRAAFYAERPEVARLLTVMSTTNPSTQDSLPAAREIEERKAQLLRTCISEAVADATLRPDVDVETLVTLIAAATNGDVRMMRMYPEDGHIDRTTTAIFAVLDLLRSNPSEAG